MVGVAPTRSGAMDPVRVDSMPSYIEPEKPSAAEPAPVPDVSPTSIVDMKPLLNRLDRELRMVEGLTPMRKSIEKKRSLEVAKLDTDAAIRKQAGYQRYIGYAEDRKAG